MRKWVCAKANLAVITFYILVCHFNLFLEAQGISRTRTRGTRRFSISFSLSLSFSLSPSLFFLSWASFTFSPPLSVSLFQTLFPSPLLMMINAFRACLTATAEFTQRERENQEKLNSSFFEGKEKRNPLITLQLWMNASKMLFWFLFPRTHSSMSCILVWTVVSIVSKFDLF